jgi:hypothetical protein
VRADTRFNPHDRRRADTFSTGVRLARPTAAGGICLARQSKSSCIDCSPMRTSDCALLSIALRRSANCTQGIELTPGELDLFVESDARMSSSLDGRIALLIH